MTAPLSNYFIYTGHNSYLTGNQISSDCSDVPIEKALKRGVRAVELDVWPNSAKDDVLVLHGWYAAAIMRGRKKKSTFIFLFECFFDGIFQFFADEFINVGPLQLL